MMNSLIKTGSTPNPAYTDSGRERQLPVEPGGHTELQYPNPPANQNAMPSFIDFEASSLDLICSYPIEVGVCLADGTLLSWLIRPAPLWDDWSEAAEAIHGIPRQQLMDEGVDVRKVAANLNECLVGTVYCDAWTFDSFWLHRLFKFADTKPAFWLESISLLLAPPQINAWQGTRREVISRLGLTTHRAANDARILYETWQALRDKQA